MAVDAIIVGGGSGIRFGQKKQFLQLAGVPIIRRTVHAFENHASVDRIIIVVPSEDMARTEEVLKDVGKPLSLAAGGRTRQESVWNGLMQAKDAGLVLIHDAVRPFASSSLISRVIAGVEGFDACIPGLAVSNTLKEVEGDLVIRTVPRSRLFAVQTPQCFRTDRIIEAHEAARGRGTHEATDDSALIEDLGGKVRLVEGDPGNMKITLKEDWEIAEAILRCRTESV